MNTPHCFIQIEALVLLCSSTMILVTGMYFLIEIIIILILLQMIWFSVSKERCDGN